MLSVPIELMGARVCAIDGGARLLRDATGAISQVMTGMGFDKKGATKFHLENTGVYVASD